jgi:hypothetical protein
MIVIIGLLLWKSITVKKRIIFWFAMPCSLVQVYWRIGETSVNLYQTTRRHISVDSVLKNYHRENIKLSTVLTNSNVRMLTTLKFI